MFPLFDGVMLALESNQRASEPYKFHTGKFIADIGNGSTDRYDYCAIIQTSGKFVVLVKHNTATIAFDGTRFINNDYSHPLNHRKFKTEEEAYEKLMRWIGKMVKKDERGRYYTDTRHKVYSYETEDFDPEELDKIADTIKQNM